MTKEEMVEKFQCPGCTCGSGVKCGRFALEDHNPGFCCGGHSAGTFMSGVGRLALGLPKGFNRYGPGDKMFIRFHKNEENEGLSSMWNHLNIPVWAMVEDGFLFVRTYSPRVNTSFLDVVEGGTLSMVPGAIDVSKFIDDID